MNIGDRIEQCGLAGCFFNFWQSSKRPLNFFSDACRLPYIRLSVALMHICKQPMPYFAVGMRASPSDFLVFSTPARGFPLNPLPFRELQDVPFVWLKQAISRSKTCRLV